MLAKLPIGQWLSSLVFALMMFAGISLSALAKEPFTLNGIHADIVKDYDGVAHMQPDVLAKKLKSDKDVVLFDVREVSEYGVSRIPGAAQVDPGIWHRQFMNRFAGKTKGKTVIFYCSVGVRSSKLARYVQQALLKNGAKGVYNLKGGVFEWHNEKRQLSNKTGSTDYVHPYNKHWGQLVNRHDLTRYAPQR